MADAVRRGHPRDGAHRRRRVGRVRHPDVSRRRRTLEEGPRRDARDAEAFENDPKLVWEWYDWRRGMIRDAKPNAAHHVLARWTRERPASRSSRRTSTACTSAPAPSAITRLHGSIWHVRCWSGCAAGRDGLARRHRAAADAAAALPALRRPRPAGRRLVRREPRPGDASRARPRRPRVRRVPHDRHVRGRLPRRGLVHQAKRRGARR